MQSTNCKLFLPVLQLTVHQTDFWMPVLFCFVRFMVPLHMGSGSLNLHLLQPSTDDRCLAPLYNSNFSEFQRVICASSFSVIYSFTSNVLNIYFLNKIYFLYTQAATIFKKYHTKIMQYSYRQEVFVILRIQLCLLFNEYLIQFTSHQFIHCIWLSQYALSLYLMHACVLVFGIIYAMIKCNIFMCTLLSGLPYFS